MKEKINISGCHYLYEIGPIGCWAPSAHKRKRSVKSFLNRYQDKIDQVLAAAAIGLMCLTGIWAFLVELASFCFHG